jgi:hypothetical protein
MSPQITTEDVHEAIKARKIPQCYDQIAAQLETRHRLARGSVTGQRLSRHVKELVDAKDVIVVADPELVRELGSFPKHYPPQTKFFLPIEVARERIDAKVLARILKSNAATSKAAPGKTAVTNGASGKRAATKVTAGKATATKRTTGKAAASKPAAAKATTGKPAVDKTATGKTAAKPTRARATEPAASRKRATEEQPQPKTRAAAKSPEKSAARTGSAAKSASRAKSPAKTTTKPAENPRDSAPPEGEPKQPRHLRAVAEPDLDLLAAKAAAPAGLFAPAFSSGPDSTGPARTPEEMVVEITARVAAVFAKAARSLQTEVDDVLLPVNRKWQNGQLGPDGDGIARHLSALYELATSNAKALSEDARALTRGAAKRGQTTANTATA